MVDRHPRAGARGGVVHALAATPAGWSPSSAGVKRPMPLWLLIPMLVVLAALVEFALASVLGRVMRHTHNAPLKPSRRSSSVRQDVPPD